MKFDYAHEMRGNGGPAWTTISLGESDDVYEGGISDRGYKQPRRSNSYSIIVLEIEGPGRLRVCTRRSECRGLSRITAINQT